MQEDFLHYIWKNKKMSLSSLRTVDDAPLEINDIGQHNLNSGPDFFNAQVRIDDQLWAGNVEIHIKSSDWYVHNHEQDNAYDNVVLHVVWEHDSDIFRKNSSVIPTLELKNFVSRTTLETYNKLLTRANKWINCENDFEDVDSFLINNWLERLYFERLEAKSETINALLKNSKNDWEATLFKMLARNFGLKVNGDSFFDISNSFDFGIVRKLQPDELGLEALLLGQGGIFEQQCSDTYFELLKSKYEYIRHKFQLSNKTKSHVQYFRLRPNNFPTIRLSQLANLYGNEPNLVSKVIEANTVQDFYKLFNVSASNYWDSHYSFGTESKGKKKSLTRSFIDLLLINTLIPFKFCYAQQTGSQNVDKILNIIQDINSEKNSLVDKFNGLSQRKISNSALQSQGLLQLKYNYCDKNKCLQCAIGNSLLNRR